MLVSPRASVRAHKRRQPTPQTGRGGARTAPPVLTTRLTRIGGRLLPNRKHGPILAAARSSSILSPFGSTVSAEQRRPSGVMERHVAPTPLPRFIRIDAPAILMLRDNPSIRIKTDFYPDASSSNHGAHVPGRGPSSRRRRPRAPHMTDAFEIHVPRRTVDQH